MHSNTILEVKDLSISFKKNSKEFVIVDPISFTLEKGKTLAIVGESASGKTVLAHSFLRLLPSPPFLPPNGTILFKGENILQFSKKQLQKIRGNRIAMIFQNPLTTFNPVYTIGYQLEEVLQTHTPMSSSLAQKKILSALEEVKLRNPLLCLKQYPHQLSGGMLQRVSLAMALLCSPDILIADEPTTALDVCVQYQILSLLKNIQQKTNMAIILISHDMGVVSEIANDIIVLYAGQILEKAPAYTLFANMSHPYTQSLFASQPHLHNIKNGKLLSVIPGNIPHYSNFPKGCRFEPRCPKAFNKCKKEIPCLKEIEMDHKVRCWLYEK